MGKLAGRFVLMIFTGLIPASEPFHRPRDLAKADLPLGTFVRAAALEARPGDSVTIERRKDGYHLVFTVWHENPVEFDARLFTAGADPDGEPAYFLDLVPLADRPERHGLPAGAKHLAAKVRWTVEGERAWLVFEPVNKDWLDDHKPGARLKTPALRTLLAKGVESGAFNGRVELYRE